jgi:hypothetical protein
VLRVKKELKLISTSFKVENLWTEQKSLEILNTA